MKVLTAEKEALEKIVEDLGKEVRNLNQQMGELQTKNIELLEKMDKVCTARYISVMCVYLSDVVCPQR